MARLIFWLAVIALFIMVWRRRQNRSAPRATPTAQPVQACAYCGVHVPQSLAISHHGRWYCEAAHVPLE